jgi:dGTPase
MNWEAYLNPHRLRPTTRNTELDARNEFESDMGRIIFSPAIRRMHDKTQVQPLTSDDNIHSRLTHSLEVMTVGYSLGLNLCNDESFIKKTKIDQAFAFRTIPIILKNACLVHDIGNPPFGHFGETVIQNYFERLFTQDEERERNNLERMFHMEKEEKEDFQFFDGNAQGFRVLTKLQVLDDAFGLNLTYATLGAYLKYPNTGPKVKAILSQKKRGVFQSEKKYLQQIAEACDLNVGNKIIRHPLSFLMEAADSICYLVMDIEDGFNKNWYDFESIKRKLIKIHGMDVTFKEIESKSNNEITKVVNLRLALIKRLVSIANIKFVENLDLICTGDYSKELINDDPHDLAKNLLDFCHKIIFTKKEIRSLELTGHSVLTGLLDYYIGFCFHENNDYKNRAEGLISNSIKKAALIDLGVNDFKDLSDYNKLRVIVDFITGMTDQYALNHYQKLSGQKII